MSEFSWFRDQIQGGIETSSADYQAVEITTFTATAWTVHRIILDWAQWLLQTSGTGNLPSTVPAAIGIMATTAAIGDDPAPPTAGPITNPDGPWWWAQGTPWRPIGPYGSGDSYSGSSGRIDRGNNTGISAGVDTTLWLVSEAYAGSSVFSDHYISAYCQVLYAPAGS